MAVKIRSKQRPIKDLIKECFAEDFKTRTNDLWLLINVWKKQGFIMFIPYDKIPELYTIHEWYVKL